MFSFFKRLIQPQKEHKVVAKKCIIALTGLVNAGKTTLVAGLRQKCSNFIKENPYLLLCDGHKINYVLSAFDLGDESQPRDPAIWANYLAEAFGLIFVVDASDRENIEKTRAAIFEIADDPRFCSKPLVIFANKQDLRTSMSEAEVEEQLDLESIVTCKYYVQRCTALTPEGEECDENIGKGLRWVVTWIYDHYESLSLKVSRDLAIQGEIDKLLREFNRRRMVKKMTDSRRQELEHGMARLEGLQSRSHLMDFNIDRAIRDMQLGKAWHFPGEETDLDLAMISPKDGTTDRTDLTKPNSAYSSPLPFTPDEFTIPIQQSQHPSSELVLSSNNNNTTTNNSNGPSYQQQQQQQNPAPPLPPPPKPRTTPASFDNRPSTSSTSRRTAERPPTSSGRLSAAPPSREVTSAASGASARSSRSRDVATPSTRRNMGSRSDVDMRSDRSSHRPGSKQQDSFFMLGSNGDTVLPYDGPQAVTPSYRSALTPNAALGLNSGGANDRAFSPQLTDLDSHLDLAASIVGGQKGIAVMMQVQRERDLLRERVEDLEKAESIQRERETRVDAQLESLQRLVTDRTRRQEQMEREFQLERDKFMEQLQHREEEISHLKKQYATLTEEYRQGLIAQEDLHNQQEQESTRMANADQYMDFVPSSTRGLEWEAAAAEAELRQLHDVKIQIKRQVNDFSRDYREREGRHLDKSAMSEIQPLLEQCRQIEAQERFVSDNIKRLRGRLTSTSLDGLRLSGSNMATVGLVTADGNIRAMSVPVGRPTGMPPMSPPASNIPALNTSTDDQLVLQPFALPGTPDTNLTNSRTRPPGTSGRPSLVLTHAPNPPSRGSLTSAGNAAAGGGQTSRPSTAMQNLQSEVARLKLDKINLENNVQEVTSEWKRKLVETELRLRKESGQLIGELKEEQEAEMEQHNKALRDLEMRLADRERKYHRELQSRSQEINALRKEISSYEKMTRQLERVKNELENEKRRGLEIEQRFASFRAEVEQSHLNGHSSDGDASEVADLRRQLDDKTAELQRTKRKLVELELRLS